MRATRYLAWGLILALVPAVGCGLFRKKTEAEPAAAQEPGARLLATGPNDGVQADKLVEGKVTAVDKMLGIAFINVGVRQGVRPRWRFTVFRGAKFVGTIVVDEVFPDMSSARYGRTMKMNADVGDEVTTK